MPFFSIIVPVYKVEAYLSQCVDSILSQSFEDFELLLIDDGSPDRSGTLCDEYARKDSRVRVIHKDNGGLSSARNCGLRAAIGEYVAFLDSDDYWESIDTLEVIYQQIQAHTADVVLLKHRKLDMKTGKTEVCPNTASMDDLVGLSYSEQLRFCVSRQLFDACAWNKVFRRNLMEKQDLFFVEGIIAEDVDWAARLSLAASGLAIIPEPVHIYRKGREGAITSSLKLKNLVDTKGSIERCLQYVSDTDMPQPFLQSYYGYVAYRYAIWMAESAVLKDPEKEPLIREMKQYCWLLDYSLSWKVKLARIAVRLLGFNGAAKLLGMYLCRKSSFKE